ncbi:MAG: LCP family protein [Actinomycetota bacterium]|nr:LCP family protein [Actinomycetota bacterium]
MKGTRYRRARTLGGALFITAGAALLPGSGHLVLRRRPTGYLLVGLFLLGFVGSAVLALTVPRGQLVEHLLSPTTLMLIVVGSVFAGLLWLLVVLRTYELARPRRLDTRRQVLGGLVVLALCMGVSAPFGFAAYTANSQRNLINHLFPGGGDDGEQAGTSDVNAIRKPRLNILLVGSDAGSDRIGTRTDTMVVASIDTKSGKTILFSLPRNMARTPFPPGSAMAKEFPNGFYNPRHPQSNDYLLNAVYAFGTNYPTLAPPGPSRDPGLNLLYSAVSTILGLDLDYYIVVDMQGFASIVDALGGLDVNVGPEWIPVGGIGPFGEAVKPFRYIPPGLQHLTGEQALWFARSRTHTTDYARMRRQRCLLQYMIDQKSPIDVLKNFQAVAAATTNSVSTNIPQRVLPDLVALAGRAKATPMKSIVFDPNLPDPSQQDGRFDTGDPDYDYVRQVVNNALKPPPAIMTMPSPTRVPGERATSERATTRTPPAPSTHQEAPRPTSLGVVCGGSKAK